MRRTSSTHGKQAVQLSEVVAAIIAKFPREIREGLKRDTERMLLMHSAQASAGPRSVRDRRGRWTADRPDAKRR